MLRAPVYLSNEFICKREKVRSSVQPFSVKVRLECVVVHTPWGILRLVGSWHWVPLGTWRSSQSQALVTTRCHCELKVLWACPSSPTPHPRRECWQRAAS